jgi:hypothetical protein
MPRAYHRGSPTAAGALRLDRRYLGWLPDRLGEARDHRYATLIFFSFSTSDLDEPPAPE